MEKDTTMRNAQSKKKLIIILVALAILIGAALTVIIVLQNPPQPEIPHAIRFKEEYPMVSEDNPYVYKSIKEIADIMEKGTGLIFLGFPSCIWCQAYTAILDEVAADQGVKEIYYCDIKEDRENNSAQYQRLVKMLEGRLELNSEGNPRIFVPDLTAVKNGVIVGHDNESSTLSDIDPVDYWTIGRVNALKQRMETMIKEMMQ